MDKAELDVALKIFESVFAEFRKDGKVSTVRCDRCGGLVELEVITESCWKTRCPCGKYNDTLKGL